MSQLDDHGAAATDGRDGVPAPPRLSGRSVRLRPVLPPDTEHLYQLVTSDELGFRWRFRGSTPSPDSFLDALWQRVLAQFVVEDTATGNPVGLVVAYAAHPARFCHIAALSDMQYLRSGKVMEAMVLFITYLFAHWDFRKLYAESLEFNFVDFASGAGRFFHEEGRLKEHDFYAGRYWDLVTLAIYRDEWTQQGATLIRGV